MPSRRRGGTGRAPPARRSHARTSGLPFATATIGMRFSNFRDAGPGARRSASTRSPTPTRSRRCSTSRRRCPRRTTRPTSPPPADAADTPAARRLAVRIRALGIDRLAALAARPRPAPCSATSRAPASGIVVDTGSMRRPGRALGDRGRPCSTASGSSARAARPDARRARRGAPHLPRRAARSDPGRRHGARRPDRGRGTEVRHLPARRDPAPAEGAPERRRRLREPRAAAHELAARRPRARGGLLAHPGGPAAAGARLRPRRGAGGEERSPRRRCTCASVAGSRPRAAATCRRRGRVHRSKRRRMPAERPRATRPRTRRRPRHRPLLRRSHRHASCAFSAR